MKKLKFLIPITILFAAPWTHKLIYMNFLAAFPDMDHSAAHFFGFMGAIVAGMVTFGLLTF